MKADAVSRLSKALVPPATAMAKALSQAKWVPIEEKVAPGYPSFWVKGQLLNVRNNGAEFVVTILGEEFDPRCPDRALRFDNSFTCQQFVSKWYAREAADPRAR